MKTTIFHLHALSALHVGIGQAVGAVDLPIMRARASNLPIVPGSALKGVLRDEFKDNAQLKRLFGPESDDVNKDAHAGALAIGDAHLLILPVRSLAGVVAFVTCPFVLARYALDLKRSGSQHNVPKVDDGDVLISKNSVCKADGSKVVLEDIDLSVTGEALAEEWGGIIAKHVHPGDEKWQALFKQHFVIVADNVFGFLADTATEVRARIRINDKGTVEPGALWYEENLPAESVLWGVSAFGTARDKEGKPEEKTPQAMEKSFIDGVGVGRTIQIGGKATIGRGLVRFLI